MKAYVRALALCLAVLAVGCSGAAATPTAQALALTEPPVLMVTETSVSATPAPPFSATPASSPTPASLIAATGAFFAVSVADVNASAQWYSDKLGLKIVSRPSSMARRLSCCAGRA